MPYCRKCGTQLNEDAIYCYKCGKPVNPSTQTSTTSTGTKEPLKRNPLFIPVLIIIVASISILVIAAIASAPLSPIDFNQTNEIIQPDVNSLNLTFWADVAEVNIFTNLTGSTMVMDVSATGGTSIFNSNQPVTVNVENSTVNNSAEVNARVSTGNFPFSGNINLIVNIYVNPELDLVLRVQSSVGQVTMHSNSETKIKSLNLRTSTGTTVLNIEEGASINGNISLQTGTGNVEFNMNQAKVNGNITINLDSGTGSVNMNIKETQQLNGNIQINANTGTGQVNLDRMLIDGEVGARIESNTGLGQITTDVYNFAGNKSPIESNNYPAASNINIQMHSGIGNINIIATYQTNTVATMRN